MGLAASQARFLSLTSRKNNIEFRGQQINQHRMVLSSMEMAFAQEMSQLLYANPDLSAFTVNQQTGDLLYQVAPGDPLYRADLAQVAQDYNQLQINIANLQSQDKVLEMKLKDVDTQHNEVQTEIDAVKKVIDKNIDMTFKTFA